MPAARPAKKPAARVLRLFTETAYCPAEPLKVEGNRIKDVLIVSRESKNRRRYSDKALAQLAGFYEGRMMNLNHPAKNAEWTKVEDRFSWLENVRRDQSGCRGDVCFNEAHPFAPTFRWWATNKPAAIGLSHNAEGYGEEDAAGVLQIDEIERVHSVDIVADPATTNGLFESRPAPLRETNMDPELNPDTTGAGDTGKCGLDERMAKAVGVILKDESLDKKAKLKKIGLALDLLDKDEPAEDLMEDDEEEGEEDKKGEEAMEALRKSADPHVKTLLEELDRRRVADAVREKREKALEMCEAAKLPKEFVGETFVNSLVTAPDVKTMQALIEDRRTLIGTVAKPKGGKRPVSAGAVQAEATMENFLEGFNRAERE